MLIVQQAKLCLIFSRERKKFHYKILSIKTVIDNLLTCLLATIMSNKSNHNKLSKQQEIRPIEKMQIQQ